MSPAPAGPEIGREEEPTAASATPRITASRPWVRPVALVVAVLCALAAIGIVIRYGIATESLATPLTSPAVAIVLALGTIAVMALAVIVFRPERGTPRALIGTSVTWSAALLLALVIAWSAIAAYVQRDRWRGELVTNAAEVDAFLAAQLPQDADVVRVPTGVLIQSVEFLSGDNVEVSGFVWQRYGSELPDDLERGVVLVEGGKEAYALTEAYRYEADGVETVGWYFAATLHQPFEYARFPFDEQDVWIRLWPSDFSQQVVLVPDFASYVTMSPSDLPAIESEFVYGGWTPLYSGYSLYDERFDTSFGMGGAQQYRELPDLYFNLVLDRDFAGPFFNEVVFFLAVTIVLFGLVVLTTSDATLRELFHVTTATALTAASGLLFAVILKHSQLRTMAGSPGVTYLEAIPLLLYAFIVLALLNAILVASPLNMKLVTDRNNLWPVLAYWPVFIGALLAATLIVFFRN